jgi:hypothetical protein
MTTLESLGVAMRRHMEAGEYDEAARIAMEIDRIVGDPPEDDHVPEPIPHWDCEH